MGEGGWEVTALAIRLILLDIEQQPQQTERTKSNKNIS